MKGYLQRIATAGTNARPRVHPFVDSMYAAGRPEESAGPVVLEETRTMTKPADLPVSAEPPRTVERLVPDAHMQAEPLRRTMDEGESLSHSKSKVVKPLLPDQVEHTPAPASAVDAAGINDPSITRAPADRQGPKSLSAVASRKDSEARGTSPPSESPAWSFQPLISPSEGAPQRPAARLQSALVSSRPETPSADTLRRALRRTTAPHAGLQRPLESRSDDIQIHIGRIEVTAMHPPAPRPAPVPARKTMSLDEYLRGNAGRA